MKIDSLIKVGKAIGELHRHNESYGCLSLKNVLIDQHKNVYLNSFITKDIPPYVFLINDLDGPLRVRHTPVPHARLPDVHIDLNFVLSPPQKI